MRLNGIFRCVGALTFLATAVACIPELASWSSDGNRLAFVRPADHKLYIWDTTTQQAQVVNHGAIEFCRFSPAADQILFGSGSQSIQPGLRFSGDPNPPLNYSDVMRLDLSPLGPDLTDMMPAGTGGGHLYRFSPDGRA